MTSDAVLAVLAFLALAGGLFVASEWVPRWRRKRRGRGLR
jgi:hypothetical protein